MNKRKLIFNIKLQNKSINYNELLSDNKYLEEIKKIANIYDRKPKQGELFFKYKHRFSIKIKENLALLEQIVKHFFSNLNEKRTKLL